MNFRLILVLFFLSVFGLPVFSLSIAAPQKIVSHSAWNFQAETDFLESFSSANVLLDGEKIVVWNPPSQPVIFNEQSVLKASSLDKKLFVSIAGVSIGNHTLTIQTLDSANAVLNSKDALVAAVEPLDSGVQADWQARLDALKTEVDSLKQQLESANAENDALQQSLSKLDSRLEAQKNALSNLSSLVELVRENQASSTRFSENADRQLQELQQKISDLQEQLNPGSGATGFAAAGSFSWSFATVLGILILVGIAGFTIYRYSKEKKLY